jgi:predicted tellurium resistance membrane protein TerC
MWEALASPEIWIAFATLATLEIVLGIDNIIFISVLTGRLPAHQQARARLIGLTLAMVMRIGLLLSLSWVMGLTGELFSVLGKGISGRDLILLFGGAFLIAKATREIHNSLEVEEHHGEGAWGVGFAAVLVQIALIDVVFSLDSVITAVGLVDEVPVMVAAIVAAVLVMMLAAGPVSSFVEGNPTIKMLALAFLVLIGFALVTEGWGIHIPKGYVYFAMAFAFGVALLNIGASKRRCVKLRKAQLGDLIQVETAPPQPR